MKNRKIMCLIMVLSFALALPLNVFAWSKSPTTSTFSPDTWTISTTNSGTTVIHKISNMAYSSSRITSMINRSAQAQYSPYIGYEPGMDIKENRSSNNILDADTGYSNYPNPKYDTEKNSGNPYKDEIDVVSVRMYQSPMSASTKYFFSASYKKMKTGLTGFDINSEESTAGVSDYNVNRYEFINQITNYSISSTSLSDSETNILPAEETQNRLHQSTSSTVDDLVKFEAKEFDTYRLEMSEKRGEKYKVFVDPDPAKLDTYVKASKSLSKELGAKAIKDVPITITFNVPLSQNEIEEIFTGLDFVPKEFYGRATTSSGDRCTYMALIESLSEINEATNTATSTENHDIKGVIAIYGTINSADIEVLQNNSKVYLADATGHTAKDQALKSLNAKSNAPIKVQTHNLYWYIEK